MDYTTQKLSCFTIGHSDLPLVAFIYFLKKAKIDTIVDVRSTPYSRYQPQYNRQEISLKLNEENIEYHYSGDVVGGRYSSPELLFPDGTVDYEKVSKTKKFKSGLEKVISLMEKGRMIALMCSEKDPLRCHRFALISKNLQRMGIGVTHLYPELIRKTHTELENGLINQKDPKRQTTLLGNQTNELELAYKHLNKKIGFKQYLSKSGDDEQKTYYPGSHSQDEYVPCATDENKKNRVKQRTLLELR